MSNEFEARFSAQTSVFFACVAPCDCPPSRVTWFRLPCPGIIAGQVVDQRTGDGLENINIWVESFETGSFGEAVTDGLGHYLIEGLEPGEGYALTASGPGYSYRLLEDGVLPEEGLVQNVVMARTGAIYGILTNDNGQPVEGATVYMFQENAPSWGRGEIVTDEDGYYCFCDVDVSNAVNLDHSNYEILALHPEYSFIQTTLSLSAHYQSSDEATLNGVMPELATIQGVVTVGGAPLMDALVGLSEDSNGLLGEGSIIVTDENGMFSLRVNAPASYTLFAQGDQTSTTEIVLAIIPGEVLNQNLEVLPPGWISGRATGVNETPLDGLLIEVMQQADDIAPLTEPMFTDSDGNFGPTLLPPTGQGVSYLVRASILSGDEYSLLEEKANIAVLPNNNTTVNFEGIPAGV